MNAILQRENREDGQRNMLHKDMKESVHSRDHQELSDNFLKKKIVTANVQS